MGGRLDHAVVDALYEGMTTPAPKGSVWAEGDLRRVITEVLRRAATETGRSELLLGALERMDDLGRGRLGGTLVKLAFRERLAEIGEGGAPERPAASSLTTAQRELLELLCRFDSGWGGSTDQGHALRKLGLPGAPPSMLLYLGHPREPDLLDRPFAFGERTGTVRELWPLLCTKEEGVALAPAVGAALARAFSPEQLPEAVDLCLREVVPHGFAANATVLHALVASGSAVVAPLLDALRAYHGRGPVSFWDSRDRRRVGSLAPVFQWVALHALNPSTQRPRGLRFDGTVVEITLRNAHELGPVAAGWMKAALP